MKKILFNKNLFLIIYCYIYDIKYNRLLPADAKYEEPTQKPTENPEDKLKQIFDLKYNITPSPSPSLKEGFANEGEKNQIPENVDNKLLEIYQKTVTPSEYVNPDEPNLCDIIYSYNYIFIDSKSNKRNYSK